MRRRPELLPVPGREHLRIQPGPVVAPDHLADRPRRYAVGIRTGPAQRPGHRGCRPGLNAQMVGTLAAVPPPSTNARPPTMKPAASASPGPAGRALPPLSDSTTLGKLPTHGDSGRAGHSRRTQLDRAEELRGQAASPAIFVSCGSLPGEPSPGRRAKRQLRRSSLLACLMSLWP